MNLKVNATIGSRNFFVSLLSIILFAFEVNNLPTGADPGAIVDSIGAGDVGRLLSILLLNFLNPVMKLIQKQAKWTWAFLKSPNFWVQVITAILAGVSIFGLQFPDGAAASVVNAVFGGIFETIAVAFIINILNPVWHFFFDRNKKVAADG